MSKKEITFRNSSKLLNSGSKYIVLRNQFYNEQKKKYTGVKLLFETSASKYISWLEIKLEKANNK